ncbi:MAG: diaminopimelate epimerase [Erysipelotrichaceae bacterium]|nr:diaminopimelate epimerase [Erysipelotrichaceae bacterium]
MHIVKMHGCGNDYIVVEYEEGISYSNLSKKLCDRRLGVGADGLIVAKRNPFDIEIYGSDGSDIPMSTNGIICYAKYCLDKGYITKNKIDVITDIGKIKVQIENEDSFMASINMGTPIYNNQSLFISDPLDSFGRILNIGDSNIISYSVFLGTVHTVIFVDDFDCNALRLASEISNYRIFNRKTNVNFVKIIDCNNIEIRTYERGIGWVLSSGSGSCAAAAVANELELVDMRLMAHQEYGSYQIEINRKGEVYITGPSIKVFECDIKEEDLC